MSIIILASGDAVAVDTIRGVQVCKAEDEFGIPARVLVDRAGAPFLMVLCDSIEDAKIERDRIIELWQADVS